MHLKGSEKRIVCLRSADSRLFREAFFVLREDAQPAGEEDMLAEANRILDENCFRRVRGKRGMLRSVGLFLLGATCSAVGFLAASWLFG